MAVRQRQTDSLAASPFTQEGWVKVMLLCMVTFGIYGALWFKSRVPQANQTGPSSPIPDQLPMVYLGLVIANLACAFVAPKLSTLVSLASWGVMLYMVFQLRSAMMEFAQRRGHNLQLNPVYTFFANILYLQYHMNKL